MWSWQERSVDRDQPHLVLNHDEHDAPIAVVGPQDGEVFGLLDPKEELLFP